MRRGRTYVLSSEPYDGWAKIGRTNGPAAARLHACQTGNPRLLVLRVEWLVDVEEELHRWLAPLRGHGEWFALPMAMVADMATLNEDERPLVRLRVAWTLERVWSLGIPAPSGRQPEALARLFMSPASSRSLQQRAVVGLFDRPRSAHESHG